MKTTTPKRALLIAAVLLGVVSIAATAAAQSQAGKSKRAKADFVRGNENTKAKRVTPPKTEQEAVAKRRLATHGIVELQLPEDRMVNLVAVRHADGTITYRHVADGEPMPTQNPQGEVK